MNVDVPVHRLFISDIYKMSLNQTIKLHMYQYEWQCFIKDNIKITHETDDKLSYQYYYVQIHALYRYVHTSIQVHSINYYKSIFLHVRILIYMRQLEDNSKLWWHFSAYAWQPIYPNNLPLRFQPFQALLSKCQWGGSCIHHFLHWELALSESGRTYQCMPSSIWPSSVQQNLDVTFLWIAKTMQQFSHFETWM